MSFVQSNLGLLSYEGSKDNNLCYFKNSPEAPHSTGPLGRGDLATSAACVVIYEPDDPDPNKIFKMAVECGDNKTDSSGAHRIRIAYSADGYTWDVRDLPPLALCWGPCSCCS